ncbi:MAG: spondin domain-containing protein [Methylocella sp.]
MIRLTSKLRPVLLMFALVAISGPAFGAGGPRFEIAVTDLTAHQTFTPILAASAEAGVTIFKLGRSASKPLQDLAESGDTKMLKAALLADPRVLDVETSSSLAPGASETLTVKSRGSFDHVIVAAMLIPTNAGFFALNGVEGPHGDDGDDRAIFYSPAYDAGSKPDDELCVNIPGGGSCHGTGFVPQGISPEATNSPVPTTAVGYVFIHRGIHGIGDLPPQFYDWRNPVAKIVIKRVDQD